MKIRKRVAQFWLHRNHVAAFTDADASCCTQDQLN